MKRAFYVVKLAASEKTDQIRTRESKWQGRRKDGSVGNNQKGWMNKDMCHYTALLAELESLGASLAFCPSTVFTSRLYPSY